MTAQPPSSTNTSGKSVRFVACVYLTPSRTEVYLGCLAMALESA